MRQQCRAAVGAHVAFKTLVQVPVFHAAQRSCAMWRGVGDPRLQDVQPLQVQKLAEIGFKVEIAAAGKNDQVATAGKERYPVFQMIFAVDREQGDFTFVADQDGRFRSEVGAYTGAEIGRVEQLAVFGSKLGRKPDDILTIIFRQVYVPTRDDGQRPACRFCMRTVVRQFGSVSQQCITRSIYLLDTLQSRCDGRNGP